MTFAFRHTNLPLGPAGRLQRVNLGLVVGTLFWWIVLYSFIDSYHLLNLLKDPSNISGAFRGILFPLSSSSFLSCKKAAVRILAKVAMDLSPSSSEDRRYSRGRDGGHCLGLDGSEEGLDSSGNPAGVAGPVGGPLPPFLPWRSGS